MQRKGCYLRGCQHRWSLRRRMPPYAVPMLGSRVPLPSQPPAQPRAPAEGGGGLTHQWRPALRMAEFEGINGRMGAQAAHEWGGGV
jgi:hypothetical protein